MIAILPISAELTFILINHTIIIMIRVFHHSITACDSGKDIRTFLRSQGYSRHILASIKPIQDAVLVNGRHELLRYILQEGDVLTIQICDEESSRNVIPAPVPFSIIYEDEDLLVIDKPADVAIHPAVGHPANTLANGLAWHYKQLGIPFVFRCINRLDRDTTGLLIVAKNLVSSSILETALQKHEIHRTYLSAVEGTLSENGTIDLPIGRKENSLIERCIDYENGDRAVTHYRILGAADIASRDRSAPSLSFTILEIRLETGRTHQIRVHMAAIGHPLLGDSLYNPRWISQFEKGIPKPDAELPCHLARQALHSWKLDLTHPITKEPLHFEAPVPADMSAFIGSLHL